MRGYHRGPAPPGMIGWRGNRHRPGRAGPRLRAASQRLRCLKSRKVRTLSRACSKPEGFVVGVTRRRSGFPGRVVSCSKPEGFVVGVTIPAGGAHLDTPRLLKARRLRRRGHTRRGSGAGLLSVLLKARRLRRRGHVATSPAKGMCSTLLKARRLRRRGHPPAPAGARWPRAAQGPKASSSGSRSLGAMVALVKDCSKPEGFVVGVTRRHAHRGGVLTCCSKPEGFVVGVTGVSVGAMEVGDSCSKPEGFVVGVTLRRFPWLAGHEHCSKPEGFVVGVTERIRRHHAGLRAAQSPKASSSGSLDRRAVRAGAEDCSKPEGFVVGVTPGGEPLPKRLKLLKARRLRRRGHCCYNGSTARHASAQSPKASSSGSLDHPPRLLPGLHCSKPEGFVVGVTDPAAPFPSGKVNCSKPEGFVVGVTPPVVQGRVRLRLLKARRLRRRGHASRRPGPASPRSSAQSPKASSSGSQAEEGGGLGPLGCSKPEGFVVGVTHASRAAAPVRLSCSKPEGFVVGVTRAWPTPATPAITAQSPKASSSGSLPRGAPWPATRSPAQSPKASSSGSHRACLIARRFRAAAQSPKASSSGSPACPTENPWAAEVCSKPEGFVVGVTFTRILRSLAFDAAQSPKASSSGSPGQEGDLSILLGCSKPEGFVVGVTASLRLSHSAAFRCSKPEGFVVGVTPACVPPCHCP